MEGDLIGDRHPLSFYFSRRIHAAIQNATGIVVVSQALKDWVSGIRGTSQGVRVIHNGVRPRNV